MIRDPGTGNRFAFLNFPAVYLLAFPPSLAAHDERSLATNCGIPQEVYGKSQSRCAG